VPAVFGAFMYIILPLARQALVAAASCACNWRGTIPVLGVMTNNATQNAAGDDGGFNACASCHGLAGLTASGSGDLAVILFSVGRSGILWLAFRRDRSRKG